MFSIYTHSGTLWSISLGHLKEGVGEGSRKGRGEASTFRTYNYNSTNVGEGSREGRGESMEVVVGVLTTCLIIRKRQWHSIYLSLSKISFYNLKLNLSVLQTTISIAFYEPSHYKFIYKRRYFTFWFDHPESTSLI